MGEAVLGLRERKKQRTRATLIDAAVELCDRQGFAHTTVDQIAAAADVSPRTFSRYFATKDAVVLAFIDEVTGLVAIELARQPSDISELEAVYRAHVQVFNATKTATSGVTAHRLLACTRIVNSSAAMRHAAAEFRIDAANVVMAERMGVTPDDRRLKLVSAIWGAIIMTGLGDLGRAMGWDNVTVDDMVARLDIAYALFADVVAGVRQPG